MVKRGFSCNMTRMSKHENLKISILFRYIRNVTVYLVFVARVQGGPQVMTIIPDIYCRGHTEDVAG